MNDSHTSALRPVGCPARKAILEFGNGGEDLRREHEELLKRYPKFSDMEAACKCCANCKHWVVDGALAGRYEYNTCLVIDTTQMTKCCCWCEHYEGRATEENIRGFKLKIVDL